MFQFPCLRLIRAIGIFVFLLGACFAAAAGIGFVFEALLAMYEQDKTQFWNYLAINSALFLVLQYPMYKYRVRTFDLAPKDRNYVEGCFLEALLLASFCQLVTMYCTLGAVSSYVVPIMWTSSIVGLCFVLVFSAIVYKRDPQAP